MIKKMLTFVGGLVFGVLLVTNSSIAQKIASLTGSGTPGRLAKWTSDSSLGNSSLSEDKNGVVSLKAVRFADGSMQQTAIGETVTRNQYTVSPDQVISFPLPALDTPIRF